MDRVWSWYDAGGGERVEKVIKEEFSIFLNLAGYYMPVRNGSWIISLARLVVFVIILSFVTYTFGMTTLYTIHDLNFAAQAAHYTILAACSILLLFCVCSCRPELNEIMTIIGNNFYKYQHFEEPKEHQIWKNEAKNFKIKLLIIVPIFGLLTLVTVVGGPTFDSFLGYSSRVSTMEYIDNRLPIKTWHPHSKESTSTYLFYLILQIIAGGIVATVIGVSAFILIFICMAIILQLKILQNSLSSIKERAFHRHKYIYPNIKLNDETMNKCLMHCIKESVEHHKVIIRSFELIDEISYIPTGIALLVGGIIMAISCSAFILGDSTPFTYIASFLLLSWELGNQLIICYFAQEIADKSLEIQDYIYESDWITFSKEVKLSLIIIRERAKQPLALKAFHITPLSYETLSSVINATYSYINVFLASTENSQ